MDILYLGLFCLLTITLCLYRTPPYKDVNINRDVAVEFQLYRPGNGSCSEGRPFVYIAQERISPGNIPFINFYLISLMYNFKYLSWSQNGNFEL